MKHSKLVTISVVLSMLTYGMPALAKKGNGGDGGKASHESGGGNGGGGHKSSGNSGSNNNSSAVPVTNGSDHHYQSSSSNSGNGTNNVGQGSASSDHYNQYNLSSNGDNQKNKDNNKNHKGNGKGSGSNSSSAVSNSTAPRGKNESIADFLRRNPGTGTVAEWLKKHPNATDAEINKKFKNINTASWNLTPGSPEWISYRSQNVVGSPEWNAAHENNPFQRKDITVAEFLRQNPGNGSVAAWLKKHPNATDAQINKKFRNINMLSWGLQPGTPEWTAYRAQFVPASDEYKAAHNGANCSGGYDARTGMFSVSCEGDGSFGVADPVVANEENAEEDLMDAAAEDEVVVAENSDAESVNDNIEGDSSRDPASTNLDESSDVENESKNEVVIQ